MKNCENCGYQMLDQAQFCTNCGTNCHGTADSSQNTHSSGNFTVPETGSPEIQPLNKKRSSKKVKVIIILSAVVAVLAVCGFLFARWFFSAEQRALRFLKGGKYSEALELVEDERLARSDDFEDILIKRLDEIKNKFSDGTMEYSTVIDELDAIEKMEIEEVNVKLADIRSFTEELNTSRTCFTAGEDFFAAGEYVRALEMYKQVIKSDNNYDAAKSRITECTSKYKQSALQEAAKYAEDNSYSNAITVLNSALEVIPGDSELTSQKLLYEKNNIDQIKAGTLQEAESYAANKDYENAMSVLDKFSVDYGSDSEVSVKRNEYQEAYVESVLEKVDSTDDYSEKIKYLQDGLSVVKDNNRLSNRLTAVTKDYAEKICEKADALVTEKKYDDAINVIDEALKTVPDNATLVSKKEEIENKMPKKFLYECKPYESSSYEEFINGRTFAMASEDYTDGFKIKYNNGYGLWNINSKYTHLEFDVGHIDGTYMKNAVVEIYLDGVLYKSIEIKADGLPQHISLDLTDVKQLKIKMTGGSYDDVHVGVGNVIAHKV